MITEALSGVAIGTIAGIVPGTHPNLLATLLASQSATLILATALAHTVTSTLALVYLWYPNEDTVLAQHPIAQLSARGLGHEAVKLLCLGNILGLTTATILTPFLLMALVVMHHTLAPYTVIIVTCLVLFFILHEPTISRKIGAVLVVILSGVLGHITLNSDITDPLFPLFTGLFGIPALFTQFAPRPPTRRQQPTDMVRPNLLQLATTVLGSIVSVSTLTLLPGMSVSQASLMSTFLLRIKKYTYLVLLGSTQTLDYYFSLLSAQTLGKTRNGALEIIGAHHFTPANQWLFISVLVFSTALATLATLYMSRHFPHIPHPRLLTIIVLALLFGAVLYISGHNGILVLASAASIGALPLLFKTNRTHLMSCLILPWLIRYGI
ncbi:tripartite tricarboxylate transporter permease [Candidatus Woesearchaeota archaeon]|nr:tripartite tricarboxylate transporter permease [Candidatus Woesearchaeota archaeon]